MKEFDIRTKIYFGPGALDRLKDLPYHRYLIVTDPFVVSSGLIRLITDPLDQHGAMYRLFDQVVPDPPIEKIVEGVQALTDFEPDSILCVGGGSASLTEAGVRLLDSFEQYQADVRRYAQEHFDALRTQLEHPE